jgi:hypothetical protein
LIWAQSQIRDKNKDMDSYYRKSRNTMIFTSRSLIIKLILIL